MKPKKTAATWKSAGQEVQRLALLMVTIAEERTEPLKKYKNAAAFSLQTIGQEIERSARILRLLKEEQKAAQLLQKKATEELKAQTEAIEAARKLLAKARNIDEIENADNVARGSFVRFQAADLLEEIRKKAGPALTKQEKTQKATEKAREQFRTIGEKIAEEINKQRKEYTRKLPAPASFGLN